MNICRTAIPVSYTHLDVYKRQDEERRAADELQKITDKFIAEVDKALEVKEADLMAV